MKSLLLSASIFALLLFSCQDNPLSDDEKRLAVYKDVFEGTWERTFEDGSKDTLKIHGIMFIKKTLDFGSGGKYVGCCFYGVYINNVGDDIYFLKTINGYRMYQDYYTYNGKLMIEIYKNEGIGWLKEKLDYDTFIINYFTIRKIK